MSLARFQHLCTSNSFMGSSNNKICSKGCSTINHYSGIRIKVCVYMTCSVHIHFVLINKYTYMCIFRIYYIDMYTFICNV